VLNTRDRLSHGRVVVYNKDRGSWTDSHQVTALLLVGVTLPSAVTRQAEVKRRAAIGIVRRPELAFMRGNDGATD
jgi:hypothetical protein